jgi:hypothetical protein
VQYWINSVSESKNLILELWYIIGNMIIFGNCSVMKLKLSFLGLIKDTAVGRMEEWESGMLRR